MQHSKLTLQLGANAFTVTCNTLIDKVKSHYRYPTDKAVRNDTDVHLFIVEVVTVYLRMQLVLVGVLIVHARPSNPYLPLNPSNISSSAQVSFLCSVMCHKPVLLDCSNQIGLGCNCPTLAFKYFYSYPCPTRAVRTVSLCVVLLPVNTIVVIQLPQSNIGEMVRVTQV